jgi:hypothetical protein
VLVSFEKSHVRVEGIGTPVEFASFYQQCVDFCRAGDREQGPVSAVSGHAA